MKEELLKGLNEEQIAKVKACKNNQELLSLAKEEGVELTDDQLEAVSGGVCTKTPEDPGNGFPCLACGNKDTKITRVDENQLVVVCPKCGYGRDILGSLASEYKGC